MTNIDSYCFSHSFFKTFITRILGHFIKRTYLQVRIRSSLPRYALTKKTHACVPVRYAIVRITYTLIPVLYDEAQSTYIPTVSVALLPGREFVAVLRKRLLLRSFLKCTPQLVT